MARSIRLSLGECALICVFAIIATLVLAPPRIERIVSIAGPTELNSDVLGRLIARYGSDKYSQGVEELLIRDFFQDQRGGIFVDVGAYEPQKWSNTFFLEDRLEWTGVAVDALAEFAEAYRQTRPRTRYVVAFASDKDEGTETLHLNPSELAVSSHSQSFTRLFYQNTEPRVVAVRTVDSILAEAGITSVDFMSMDIELGEPAALRGFAVKRFRPRLVCVEAHEQTRQAILDYFASNDYVLVGKYLLLDRVNLYFMPQG
jgi:FkbM family methyltransferase